MAVPKGLDTQPYQVGGTHQPYGGEDGGRALYDRSDAQRHACGHNPVSRCMSCHREQRGAPTVGQGPPDDEQDTWAGDDDQDESRGGKGGDLTGGDHPISLTLAMPEVAAGYGACPDSLQQPRLAR